MKSRKVGLWWEDWYSICSRHREHDESCRLCALGAWRNRNAQRWSSVFYAVFPWGWRKWENRKNSQARKRVERLLPKLWRGHETAPATEPETQRDANA